MPKAGIQFQKKDQWNTPKEVVDFFGPFDYDPATTKEQAEYLGVEVFDDINSDGLKSDWAHEICRDNFTTPEAKDACGDVLVTIIILADICGIDPIECLESAYHEISGRKGHTSEGMFIKEV